MSQTPSENSQVAIGRPPVYFYIEACPPHIIYCAGNAGEHSKEAGDERWILARQMGQDRCFQERK